MKKTIHDILAERILVLDGGLGTMVQGYGLAEEDFRGVLFADWSVPLKGCNDLLALTVPDAIRRIHEAYLMAGADIISTDTFNATAVSLSDYKLHDYVYEINLEAARIARFVADEFTLKNPSKPRFVAGSMGPTSRTASMSADVSDPGARNVTFDTLAADYTNQIRGLLDGGADIILVETIFDMLNAKAAVFAIDQECARRGIQVPVMISVTLADASGRTLSGQTIEAFYASMKHARPLSVGLNCAYGAKQMRPYLERLAAVSEFPVSAHPNAGLPNLMGGYDETPEMMAADVEEFLKKGVINIIGGCCGTTPAHIGAIARVARGYKPRPKPAQRHETVLSGLEPLAVTPDANFVNIGERTNVAGSAKFARLVRDGQWDEALSIAREQVEAGAQVVDVCMDDGLIDGPEAMKRFLNLAMAEPEIARVPFMIDSSSWEVLEAGLKCVQGKSIVNSISLKEGEAEFVRKANLVREYGAAAVVMLFDEKGQADTYERKVEVAGRAYKILTDNGFPAEDIIFDPNVLAVATGIEEHDGYGVGFIEATRWIKQNLPYAKVSGGISNLSFSFRGNNKVREAMHSVFLYHAIAAGLDMGIVNPSMLQVYSDIEPELLELAEDVVLNRRPDAGDRLAEYAERVKKEGGGAAAAKGSADKWREGSLEEKLAYAMTKGVADHVEEDVMEAYRREGTPLGVIDNMLMPVMDNIGKLFGEGKMFLPQVVKSARVMKKAVDVLTPFIEQGADSVVGQAGKVLVATVKGDVHDIGKNIVSVVMSCNGYRVKDLGVMVETQDIADAAQKWGADAVGLSGLISPSLVEMAKVVEEFERRGMTVPVIIGGATTSALHTAVKIAPAYSGLVIHSRDASENITILNKLFGAKRDVYAREHREKQERLRRQFEEHAAGQAYVTLEAARRNRFVKDASQVIMPNQTGHVAFVDYPMAEAAKYIDWSFFFPAWGLKGKYPELLDSPEKGEEARKLLADARQMLAEMEHDKLIQLNGVVGIYPAVSDGDDIVVSGQDGKPVRLAQLRNQEVGKGCNLSLADFVMPAASGVQDYVCAFAVTSGVGLDKLAASHRAAGDDYKAIMAKLLADRLAEAFAESIHMFVREVLWGYEKSGMPVRDILDGKYQGIRAVFGYPACPDHSLKREVFDLLGAQAATGMRLTDNYMINPGESLCGLIFPGAEACYFDVGRIDDAQLNDYAARRGMDAEQVAALIPRNLR